MKQEKNISMNNVVKKEILSFIPSKEEFVTDKYVDEILETGLWHKYGSSIESFLDAIQYNLIPEFQKNGESLSTFVSSKSFKVKFKNWLEEKYEIEIENMCNEMTNFPLTLKKLLDVDDDMRDHILRESFQNGFDNILKMSEPLWHTGNVEDFFPAKMFDLNRMIISVKAQVKDIDWKETLALRMNYNDEPSELGIFKKRGTILNITKVELILE